MKTNRAGAEMMRGNWQNGFNVPFFIQFPQSDKRPWPGSPPPRGPPSSGCGPPICAKPPVSLTSWWLCRFFSPARARRQPNTLPGAGGEVGNWVFRAGPAPPYSGPVVGGWGVLADAAFTWPSTAFPFARVRPPLGFREGFRRMESPR